MYLTRSSLFFNTEKYLQEDFLQKKMYGQIHLMRCNVRAHSMTTKTKLKFYIKITNCLKNTVIKKLIDTYKNFKTSKEE